MSLRSSLPSCSLRGLARRLAAVRWGPALNDPTPGIIIDHPLSKTPTA